MNDTTMFEFGQMPMVEFEDGKRICQTKAILRCLGQKYGYWTADPKEAWLIDSTMDSVNDEASHLGNIQFAAPE